MKKFKKAALFTDIHWGRANNSEVHNSDCRNYINWFCKKVKEDIDIDCIIFMGDWHEHRSSINSLTLKYSYEGAKTLNELGLPVFFVIGNHDLYHRNKRDVFTTYPFDSLENFYLVNETPLVLEKNNAVIFPYLFHNEYHTVLPNYNKYDVFFGHFEFKGFILTGENRVHEHGPDHTVFSKQKRIFSGHFHKRQMKDNVVYIGNTFPADFGDANDFQRGMATYDFGSDTVQFIDWEDCPKYIDAPLSKIIEAPKKVLKTGARIRSLADIDIEFDEAVELKETLMKKFKLRSFDIRESNELNEILKETEVDLEGYETETTSNIVKQMLRQVKSDKISVDLLVKIYEEL